MTARRTRTARTTMRARTGTTGATRTRRRCARRSPPPLGLPAFGFYMQFDDGFADVNLGDSGVMYVFGGDAHFQCY
jgi:hypothetical protein